MATKWGVFRVTGLGMDAGKVSLYLSLDSLYTDEDGDLKLTFAEALELANDLVDEVRQGMQFEEERMTG